MRSLKHDLIERRLWPLLVVIIAAAVAVPFLLHGHRANAEVAPPPAGSGTSTPANTATHEHHAAAGKRVTPTSSTRDPFAAADVDESTTTTTTSTTSATAATTPSVSSGDSVSSSGGSTGSSSASETTTPATTTPATTTPATTPTTGGSTHATAPTRSWDIYSVDLRVGAAGHPVVHSAIARFTPLPRERSPQVMYMGVSDHGREAVFALGAGVEVAALAGRRSTGASCSPSRSDCALVAIPAGRSVGISYVSATGRVRTLLLRVSRITSRVTQSAAEVRSARHDVSPVGLCDLKLGDPIGFVDLADDSVTVPSTAACRSRKLAVAFPGSLGAGSSARG